MKTQNNTWTQIIRPRNRWFDINLSELWSYRDLVMILVRRDVVSQYKQTVMGPLWLFLGPLFTVAVYTFVFSGIADMSTDGLPGPLFYLAGTTLWNYFQSCFTGTSTTFVANAHIFGKVYFPRLVAPISVVIGNLVKFGIQMCMFLLFLLYYSVFQENEFVQPNKTMILLPLLVLLMGGISLGMGIIISALTTKYRDLTYFVSFGITLLMYATPVIYPVSAIPELYKPIVLYNPIAPIIEAFRYGFTGAGTFTFVGLLYSTFFMITVLFLGVLLFSRTERTFMDTV